jgi:hypothetical protein
MNNSKRRTTVHDEGHSSRSNTDRRQEKHYLGESERLGLFHCPLSLTWLNPTICFGTQVPESISVFNHLPHHDTDYHNEGEIIYMCPRFTSEKV